MIAKEFQKHERCYLEYTRIIRQRASTVTSTDDDNETFGNFDAVLSLIENDILEGRHCLSMETIMLEYNGTIGSKQSRYKLKERLSKINGEKLVFVQVEHQIPQVVISKECLHAPILSRKSGFFQEFTVKRAALILRELTLKFVDETLPLPWPPTVESFESREASSPKLLEVFFKELLSSKESHHNSSERVNRLAGSLSQDVVHAVSKGKFLTPKHASLALGLHSLTGQKLPITILARLGHCIKYDVEMKLKQRKLSWCNIFNQRVSLYPCNGHQERRK